MKATMTKPATKCRQSPIRSDQLRHAIGAARTAGGWLHHIACRQPLDLYANLARLFRRAVEQHPDRLFMAERDANGARAGFTYAQARKTVDTVAQALIDRGLSAERPVDGAARPMPSSTDC